MEPIRRRTFLAGAGATGVIAGTSIVGADEAAAAGGGERLRSRYLSVRLSDGVVRELAGDAEGRSRFRRSLLPAGDGWGLGLLEAGFDGAGPAPLREFAELVVATTTSATYRDPVSGDTITYAVDGPQLVIEATPGLGTGIAWAYPFEPSGYYDVDLHRTYADPMSVTDYIPGLITVRALVGGSGHTQPIEMFKRTAGVPTPGIWKVEPLRLGSTGRVLVVGDPRLDCDLDIAVDQAAGSVTHHFDDSTMSHVVAASGSGVVLEVRSPSQPRTPATTAVPLGLAATPAPRVHEPITGKTVDGNGLLAELLQHGMFHHANWGGGEWLVSLAETHRFNDPRSDYLQRFKDGLATHSTYLGFDRYGTFGLYYCWLASPSYADGLLGGVDADMRHVQVSDQFCVAVANLALATGDLGMVRARRARWLSTDSEGVVCGGNASVLDQVLHKGDYPLAGTTPTEHSLGQSFTASTAFSTVSLRIGNVHPSQASTAVVMLFPAGSDTATATTEIALPPNTSLVATLAAGDQLPPGSYRVRVSNAGSGTGWDIGAVGWWTEPATTYQGGDSYVHDFAGSLWDQLKLQFEYTHARLGADRQGVCGYLPEDGYHETKSGRPGAANNSYWEGLGNGRADVYLSIWHAAAAGTLAELAGRLGDQAAHARFRDIQQAVRTAIDEELWVVAEEGDQTWSRYAGWIDWDDTVYDYGFAYYNLEASYREVPQEERSREIFRWLDFGRLSPDGGTTWEGAIYALWESAAPFNTRANDDDVPLGGTLPWRQVLTNGGARHYSTAMDVAARARVLGPDNAWERTLAVLARFARPDRLTGGRTNDDPGGRGRWHFGDPDSDLADIEGFREIFTMEGRMGVGLVEAFLGLRTDERGLRVSPRVPLALERLDGTGLGYDGQLWTITATASRKPVRSGRVTTSNPRFGPDGHEVMVRFRATAAFNRIAVAAHVQGPAGALAGLGLRLVGTDGDVVAETWLTGVVHRQDVSLLLPTLADPGEWTLVVVAAGTAPYQRGVQSANAKLRLWSEHVDVEATPADVASVGTRSPVEARLLAGEDLLIPAD